ncbi:MAG: efflux RND transporter periplasmic adaptor subunit [Ignavibacteriales bacterium]|nr:efflux RND transporter periplasmic adaptor subunit [Ignavibacteriales bacterium]
MKNVFVLLSIMLIAGCGLKKGNSSTVKSENTPVTITKVKDVDVPGSLHTAGYFTTDDEALLSFKVGGVVKNVFVSEGDKIVKGQLLAELEKTEIEAQVTQAKTGYEKAKRDYERASALYKDSVTTLSQMQDAKTGLEIAQQTLAIARYNLSYAEIRSQKDGYILRKILNAGQIVGPGMPVLQVNGANKGNWILRAGVSDYEWGSIQLGDNAQIHTDVKPDAAIHGVVIRKAEAVDPYSGTFIVDIKPKDAQLYGVAAGMFGKATIMLSKKLHGWIIPFDALMDGDKGNGYVFTTADKKTVRKTSVRIGEIRREGIIIESGLENSEYLITAGNAYLQDGSAITVREER